MKIIFFKLRSSTQSVKSTHIISISTVWKLIPTFLNKLQLWVIFLCYFHPRQTFSTNSLIKNFSVLSYQREKKMSVENICVSVKDIVLT